MANNGEMADNEKKTDDRYGNNILCIPIFILLKLYHASNKHYRTEAQSVLQLHHGTCVCIIKF